MLTSAFTLRLGAAALLFAVAAPVVAADPVRAPADNAATDTGGAAAAAPAAPAATPVKEERRICRFDGATGSNLRGKKICLTAREWRARS
jgi:hypothetical protein